MRIHNVVQGSPEWHALRAAHYCASDAPAMMGASKRMKRNDLIRMKATGDEKEFSAWEQENLLAKGHKTERAFVEELLGEELFPVTGSDDAGVLLASFDGITMDGSTGFEHKLWNEDLAAAVQAGEVPPDHHWQLEQQILVGGLERVIFVVSDGTKKKMVHTEYRPVKGRSKALLDGWKQFEEDVEKFEHVEVLPAPSARVIKDLPVLSVKLTGRVESSNLAAYRDTALDFIRGINTNLQTDQDFADAAKTIGFCENAEKRLDVVKEQALAQTASIAELFSTLDMLRAEMRGKRLELNKLVEERKKTIRSDILCKAQTALADHIIGLNARLGKAYIPAAPVPADFAGAMKAKKTIASLQDAVDTELARAKIAMNALADRITVNLNTVAEAGGQYPFLFADTAQIVHKDPEDVATLVKLRITEHKAKEEERLAAERERIRKEEEAKAARAVQPVVAQAAAPGTVARLPTKPRDTRPADEEIITALSVHFGVEAAKVLEWIVTIDIGGAQERLALAEEGVGA